MGGKKFPTGTISKHKYHTKQTVDCSRNSFQEKPKKKIKKNNSESTEVVLRLNNVQRAPANVVVVFFTVSQLLWASAITEGLRRGDASQGWGTPAVRPQHHGKPYLTPSLIN